MNNEELAKGQCHHMSEDQAANPEVRKASELHRAEGNKIKKLLQTVHELRHFLLPIQEPKLEAFSGD